jgi:hypothetical protein
MLALGIELSSSTSIFIPLVKVKVFTSSAFTCAKSRDVKVRKTSNKSFFILKIDEGKLLIKEE